jgi:hypothetical protein
MHRRKLCAMLLCAAGATTVLGGWAGSAAGRAAGSAATAAGAQSARAVLLARSALGRSWSVSAPPPRRIPPLTCARFKPHLAGVSGTGAASSPTYAAGKSGPFFSQSAYSYASAAAESSIWHALARPGLLACIAGSVTGGSQDGVSFAVTAKRTLRLPKLQAPAAAYAVSATATSAEVQTDVYVVSIVLGYGRTISELTVTSFDQRQARMQALRLARIAAGRIHSL